MQISEVTRIPGIIPGQFTAVVGEFRIGDDVLILGVETPKELIAKDGKDEHDHEEDEAEVDERAECAEYDAQQCPHRAP